MEIAAPFPAAATASSTPCTETTRVPRPWPRKNAAPAAQRLAFGTKRSKAMSSAQSRTMSVS